MKPSGKLNETNLLDYLHTLENEVGNVSGATVNKVT
jgi:hypothetical protein